MCLKGDGRCNEESANGNNMGGDTACTHSKFAWDTKMGGVANTKMMM